MAPDLKKTADFGKGVVAMGFALWLASRLKGKVGLRPFWRRNW